ncbi:DUF692 domain-containing protein [Moritella marina ATCC 15381]|uniref:DUF692 domain-containing protein n=1 Tax=Moritella marina ATCC 15381 TaxID=1202962 RepID=A0A5J6WK93_MORMI|nr:DUF692 domain-containing protein [Moritella marina]QFI37641.1 DUF692 domain-containing protein [Moritella marina ATCC 15381]
MSVNNSDILVGVGLRHPHFTDILISAKDITLAKEIDFVEVHSENFFGQGGAALSVLKQVREIYPVSLHSTSMGLGSLADIPASYLTRLMQLTETVDPFLMSEHACFTWGHLQGLGQGQLIHSGDLLPIAHTHENLKRMCDQVDKVQTYLGRQLIIENVSAYVQFDESYLSEAEFLTQLCQRTGAKILLDINNIAVNSLNFEDGNIQTSVSDYISVLPVDSVAQIHLAGCSPVAGGQMVIDDHARPVSDAVWQGYRQALTRFGAVPTLVEWDSDLPTWSVLVGEAKKARHIANAVLGINAVGHALGAKNV